MAVRQFSEVIDGNTAVVIVVAQGQIDGRRLPELAQKPEHMGEPRVAGQQVTRHEDPVWLQLPNRAEQNVVPGMISIQVQISDLDSPSAGQGAVPTFNSRDLWAVMPTLQRREPAEEALDWTYKLVREFEPISMLPTQLLPMPHGPVPIPSLSHSTCITLLTIYVLINHT